MRRPIAISLSPNTQQDDVLKALCLIVSFQDYISGKSTEKLEGWFRDFFNTPCAVSFQSARAALFGLLKTFGIGHGDEVIIQAFTCVAVPNAIVWTGARPIYTDILHDLTIDPEDLERKITNKTKAIIVQHTFGIPTDMDAVMTIAKKHGLILIEDCAHVLGGVYKNKRLGTIADAAFFSFGRDKAFSSVFGGMAITKNETLGKKLSDFQKSEQFPSIFWVFQQLLHPVAFSIILPFYNLFLGKLFLVLLQKIRLLSLPVSPGEKKSNPTSNSHKKMPNALSALAFHQLEKLEKYNKARETFAKAYLDKLKIKSEQFAYKEIVPYLRLPIFVKERDFLIKKFIEEGIYLGKWYSEVIDPKGVDFESVYYKKGSCPKAEELASRVLNLPTYPLLKVGDVEKIIKIVNKYANH